jgi:hypothetical protein
MNLKWSNNERKKNPILREDLWKWKCFFTFSIAKQKIMETQTTEEEKTCRNIMKYKK